MSSLTIEQLKKSLTEQGIPLPPSGSKKADYIKLYNQYSTLNENLGDYYSSDDENPPRNSSQYVSSSSSPSKIESIIREVERLTDDELYTQLKELGATIGPVLKNTRKVYEKKLIKLLGGGSQTNGVDVVGSRKVNTSYKVDEFSDSEADLPISKPSYKKTDYKDSFKGRKGSVNRESPRPSYEEPILEPAVEKKYPSSDFSDFESKRHSYGDYSSEVKSSKFSFIETIPKGSTHRYIEPASASGAEYARDTVRSRFSADRTNFGQDEPYTGTWEPNIKKYLGQPQQTSYKTYKRASVLPSKASSSFKENVIGVLIVLAFILLALYLYFYQWTSSDPYKEIQDDAERELEFLTSKSADNN